MNLVRYDAARKALAAACSVDEVKHIRAQAEAMRAYARQANDPQMIADATKLRRRAERRLGGLMDAQAKTVGVAKARGSNRHKKLERVSGKPSLAEAGIDKNLANRARKAAAIPEAVFDEQVEALGEEIIRQAERRVRQGDKKQRRATRERELGERQAALPGQADKRYGVIYADPPWRFEPWDRSSGMDRAADNHYPTMTLDELEAMQVPAADDAVLFLWATVPMLPQALGLMAAWGFTYRSHFAWVKDRIGTGYWTRNQHELLLIGTRGKIPAPAPGEQYSSMQAASLGEHSAKPALFAEIVEEMFPSLPRLEMFARSPRLGWDVSGNEAVPAA